MKLAAVYNVFDGEELLPYSINNIRSVVDKVIIVYQTISNVGERHPRKDIENFLETMDCDEIILYTPHLSHHWLSAERNERNKRAIGAKKALELGCTHFLLIDCDEFYEKEQFMAAKKTIIEKACDTSACMMSTYYKSPKFKLIPNETYYVPFITRIVKGVTRFINSSDYPVTADPSRKTLPCDKFYSFSRKELIMHHYTMVRKDMMLKFRNHSLLSRQRVDINKIYQDFMNFKFGDNLTHPFENYNLVMVENLFNIPESFDNEDTLTFSLIEVISSSLGRNKIHHWLSSGTFLSLHRENRFFPWDIDVDLDLNGDTTDIKKFKNIMSSLGCVLVKEVTKKKKLVQLIFSHPQIKRLIDFYIWYEREDDYYTHCDVGTLFYNKELINKIENRNFRHIKIPCPPPDEYFTLRYGADWRVPKKVSGLAGGGWEITKNLIRDK